MAFKSKKTSFTQRKVEKGFCFFHSQKLVLTIEYHPKLFYYWVAEPLIVSLINEKGSDEKIK